MPNCFRIRCSLQRFLCLTSAVLCLAGIARLTQAQVIYGSVMGTVVDTTGSSVAGATVRLTNTGTNQSRETQSDENGGFIFTSAPGGTYSISVKKEGFQAFTVANVTVTPDSKIRVDATLRVGNVQEVIEVSGSGATLQTDSAEVRSEITAASLQNLPTPIGRNYESLLVTIPGVAPPDNQHSISANPSRGLTFSVNGSTRNSNAIRIDGALATNLWLPHVSAYSPTLEAIQAVSVVTGAADADQGLAGGSAVNVQVKSGTNQMHGSLFEYHADNALKAKPFFLPTTQRKPKFINNQFGGSLGGPVIKNKLFYFASVEATRDRQTGATIVTIPTAAILNGDMSASPNPIYDPLTGNPDGTGRTAFAGKIIPQNRIDPIARKILALMPAPTSPNLLTNNLYASAPFAVNRTKLDAKITWTPSSRMTVNGRLGWLKYDMSNPPALGELGGVPTSGAGGRAGLAHGNVYSTTYSLSYVVNPALVLDAYVGWQLTKTNHDPVRLDEKLGVDFLGIPGTNGAAELAGGWPRFSISNYTDIGTQGNSTAIRYNDWQYEIVGNVSWTRNSHTIRFGMDMARIALNHYEAPNGPGVFNFTGGATAVSGGPAPNQFNSFAQFLLGAASSVVKEELPFDDNQMTSRQTTYSFYVKDGWQAGRNLTISAGLRWDYFPLGTRKSTGLGRYDFNTNLLAICGAGDVPSDCGYRINQKNVSPRLGVAYRVSNSFVIRAGYGLNYDPYPLAFVRNMLTNYPNNLLLTINPVNAFQTVTNFAAGIPRITVPDVSSGRLNVPAAYQVRSLADYYERGYIQSWNLSLQKEFWGGFLAQAAYIGARQLKISQTLDLNAGQVFGAGAAGQPFFSRFGRTVQTALLTPVGRNQYDSLQTKIQRRFGGVQFNAAYTFSKAIGICCDELSDSLPAIQIPQYLYLARSREPFDRPHNFNTTVVAELPFGKGKRLVRDGVLSKFAGGWSVNGLLTAYSGRPFSVSASDASLNAPGNTQRADQIKSEVQILGGIGSTSSYFDPLAFAPVTAPRFGTVGYNTLRGPSAVNLDLGLFRAFNVTERWKVEFRAEALNFTNTPHFGLPNGNVSNLQLNPDGSIRSLGGFSAITSTTGVGREGVDERVVRFGLRISF